MIHSDLFESLIGIFDGDRGKSDKLKALSPRSRQVNYFADISRALKSNMPTEHRKQVKIRARKNAGSHWLKLKMVQSR